MRFLMGILVLGIVFSTASRGVALDPSPDVAASPLARPMLLGAHRGGMGEWPENTLFAFQHVSEQHPDILLEGDLQLTRDGVVVLIHDANVDRTTDGTGPVGGMALEALKRLDAGYRFSPDGGATFPFRGTGISIPTLDEVLSALPEARMVLELKGGEGIAAAAAALIRKHKAEGRLLVASFTSAVMNDFRGQAPEVAACFDMARALVLLNALRGGDWTGYAPDAAMLSLPVRYVEQFSLTAGEFARIRAKGILIQVHTLNDAGDLAHYRAMGVDSILTDYPRRLAERIPPAG